ncbi:3581_t:CDS:2, partial [Acaulospora colombiana]
RFSSSEISAKEKSIKEKKAATPESTKPTSEQKTTQEPVETKPDKTESESHNSAKKGGFGFGKALFGITLLGGISYGGAVYYSLKDDGFCSWFTSNVYGAEQVVEYVEDLQTQGTFNRIESNAIKWRDNFYEKVSGIFGSPTPPEKPLPSEKSPDVVPITPKEINIKLAERDGDEISEEIISTEEPIIRKLANTLSELDAILRNYDIKDKGEGILKKAKEELIELNNHIETLKIESQDELQKNLSELTQKFNKTVADYEQNVDDYIAEKVVSIKQDFKQEKQKLHEEHYEKLNARLKQAAEKHEKELKDELVRQAVDMHRRWIREVLERLSVDNVERLDNNEVVTTVLSTIDDSVAINGVDSISDLSARFLTVKEEVRRASLVPENGGILSHLLSIMLSKIMFRKHGYVDGNDVEAILARVQYHLNENDLDNAARELNQLKGWPKKLADDWIKSARNHLEVKQAIEVCDNLINSFRRDQIKYSIISNPG